MADIFREINDDIRRDRVLAVLQRHGGLLIGTIVILIAVTAGIVYWQNAKQNKAEQAGLDYSQAMALYRNGATEKAIVAFAGLADKNDGGYGMLARLQTAEIKARGGPAISAAEQAQGVASLKAIAGDGGLDENYRNLALVIWGLFAVDREKPESVIAAMKPLADGTTPWHYTAVEVTALADIKAGNQAAGMKAYRSLADDLTAPRGLRARATEIISAAKN